MQWHSDAVALRRARARVRVCVCVCVCVCVIGFSLDWQPVQPTAFVNSVVV